MSSYTIANEDCVIETLREYYRIASNMYAIDSTTDLDYIFNIALNNPDRFPAIFITTQKTPQNYIDRWVKGYYDALKNPPSKRIANPKSSCTDPAIAVIVKASQGMSANEAILGERSHNLFMSAENIQGNLLEEYIAFKTRPYGMLWCNGNVLRAIDFCNTNGSFFLQIKNKSNTENSSSSSIREGTDIKKWYRLGTRTKNGIKYPDYKWETLNSLVNRNKTEGFEIPPCQMNEEDYENFLNRIASYNRNLITSL